MLIWQSKHDTYVSEEFMHARIIYIINKCML